MPGDAEYLVPPAPRCQKPRPPQAAVGPGHRKYLASGEWRGKAGGYAAQGIAGSFRVNTAGSYSRRHFTPLRLYETLTTFGGEGYPIHFGWLNTV